MVHSVNDQTRGGEAVQVKISGDRLGDFFPAPDIIVFRVHLSAPIAHLYTKVGAGMRRKRSGCGPVYAKERRKESGEEKERKKN